MKTTVQSPPPHPVTVTGKAAAFSPAWISPITITSIFGVFNYQSDTSFWPLNTQKYPAPAVKAMQSAAKKSPALRVVFFASALPAHPTRKYQVFIKGQKEVSHLGGPARKVYQLLKFNFYVFHRKIDRRCSG